MWKEIRHDFIIGLIDIHGEFLPLTAAQLVLGSTKVHDHKKRSFYLAAEAKVNSPFHMLARALRSRRRRVERQAVAKPIGQLVRLIDRAQQSTTG